MRSDVTENKNPRYRAKKKAWFRARICAMHGFEIIFMPLWNVQTVIWIR